VKLCRFELKSDPGKPRSGIVYGAKIYETDGANPIGTYEADAVRPLAPVGLAPSIRFFDVFGPTVDVLLGDDRPSPLYCYGNPSSVIGPSMIAPLPPHAKRVTLLTSMAAVVACSASQIPLERADEVVLGLTPCMTLIAQDVADQERRSGLGYGRSRDFTTAIGPVLTTPDELDEVMSDDGLGRRYELTVTLKVNGEEVSQASSFDLPYTVAEAMSAASETCVLMPGDLFCLGPLTHQELQIEANDEIQLAVERLGTLSLRIAP
jgi:2-keto-4-pentenoate hydratase/2-oxohepta-3-ene-1,7-dioic acid hydratase in catechol pathway